MALIEDADLYIADEKLLMKTRGLKIVKHLKDFEVLRASNAHEKPLLSELLSNWIRIRIAQDLNMELI